jgi:hypothetical protein
LLTVEPSHAEYWEAASGKLVQAFSFLKALATDERAQGAEHGAMDIDPDKARAAAGESGSEQVD